MKYAVLLTIGWMLSGSLFGQTGSGNAFNRESTFSANEATANGSFQFDLQLNGRINYQGQSYDFDYFLNSRDGSLFFGPGASSALIRWRVEGEANNDEIFQGAYLHPGGISTQYWEDPEDGKRYAYGVNFNAFPNNTDPAALQEFLRTARKSAGPNHPRFGPTTVYQKTMGGFNIKMTITNRGLNIPISPAAIGMMTTYFKDGNQRTNRLVTKFEMPGLVVSVSEFRRSGASFAPSGYEEINGTINIQEVATRRERQEARLDSIINDTARRNMMREVRRSKSLEEHVERLLAEKETNCHNEAHCEALYDKWIKQVQLEIRRRDGIDRYKGRTGGKGRTNLSSD